MSPRRYDMRSRTDAVARTRQRIVEATVRLHGEKGIFGTSWQDIADEAEVALGTVYRHFPTLDELVPACGELLMERIAPPMPEDIERIMGDATDPSTRLNRVVAELFAFYERGGKHLDNDPRERALPAVRDWEAHMRGMIVQFLRAALGISDDAAPEDERLSLAAAALDFRAYSAMRDHGIPPDRAVALTGQMLTAWLVHPDEDDDPRP